MTYLPLLEALSDVQRDAIRDLRMSCQTALLIKVNVMMLDDEPGETKLCSCTKVPEEVGLCCLKFITLNILNGLRRVVVEWPSQSKWAREKVEDVLEGLRKGAGKPGLDIVVERN